MPKKLIKCVKKVKKKIKKGEIPQTYVCPVTGKRMKTSPFAVCIKSTGLRPHRRRQQKRRRYNG